MISYVRMTIFKIVIEYAKMNMKKKSKAVEQSVRVLALQVWCQNPYYNIPTPFKQLVSAPLLNARQQA